MEVDSNWARHWRLRPGVTYLNHGSWGPSPLPVIEAREAWSRRLEEEPVDFFVRTFENELALAADEVGRFVGAKGEDLVFLANATVGMNHVAANLRLEPGDEVLATNHEYGAVLRIWREACRTAGAELVVRKLPDFLDSDGDIAAAILDGITERTRLIVVSHVTSPTAVILPVAEICRGARQRGVPVCIDGPHAPAMVDVDITSLDCDFYCASLHKWLSAPFGSGFLYVAKRHQSRFRPLVTSWGGSFSGRPSSWKDEFTWYGTYDPSALLAVPSAIRFFEEVGLKNFRTETHALAKSARDRIGRLAGLDPLTPDRQDRYGSMVSIPLRSLDGFESGHGRVDPLQAALWERFAIEVPVTHWAGRRLIRVSCHLYNTGEQIDRLEHALIELMRSGL